MFADTTVNIDPNEEELAEIAILASKVARRFNIIPRIAMLSFSNFGSAKYKQSVKVAQIRCRYYKTKNLFTIQGIKNIGNLQQRSIWTLLTK